MGKDSESLGGGPKIEQMRLSWSAPSFGRSGNAGGLKKNPAMRGGAKG
jgi:hypothetical protein